MTVSQCGKGQRKNAFNVKEGQLRISCILDSSTHGYSTIKFYSWVLCNSSAKNIKVSIALLAYNELIRFVSEPTMFKDDRIENLGEAASCVANREVLSALLLYNFCVGIFLF